MAGILTPETGGLSTTSVDDALRSLTVDNAIPWVVVTPDEFSHFSDRLGYRLHAVEDGWRSPTPNETLAPQRSRVVRFPDHSFLSVFWTGVSETGELLLEPLWIFVNHESLVVVSSSEQRHAVELVDRWESNADLLKFGALALLQVVLDYVVDSHLETVDHLADSVDAMEDDLFDVSADTSDDPRELQMRSFATRKALVQLRRVTQPMRELVSGAMRHDDGEHPRVDPGLLPFYQDVYDHVLRVNDTIEGLRDLVTTIYETRLALFDHTLNTVTRQLAAWAAIIAVPTAVTGFYGQNVPYPGYLHLNGFLTSTTIWIGGAVILFILFKRQNWL